MRPLFRRGVLAAVAACLPFGALADPSALVIGNADYEALRDVSRADRVTRLNGALSGAGFDLASFANTSETALRQALERFEAAARPGEGAVVFLAGRFVHSATETYFLSTSARALTLDTARREGIPLATLTAILAASPGQAVLALGDGGGFDPRSPFLDGGVGDIAAPQGVTLLVGPPEDVQAILGAVAGGDAVLDPSALGGTEVALSGFVPASGRLPFAETEALAPAPDPRDAEVAFWDATRQIDTIAGFRGYLDRYPGGIYATEARERIAALGDAPRREAEAAEAALGLSRDQRREIQRALTLLGFDTRGIDGIFGRGTRTAIGNWQTEQRFENSGYLDRDQIRRLDRLARARAEELEEEARIAAELAAREDREFWRASGQSGREDDLRRYLRRYPNGIYAEDARADLDAIEDLRRPAVSAVEQLTWEQVEANGSADAYREYLRRYPGGAFAEAARTEIARLDDEAARGSDRQAAARGEAVMNLSATTRRTIEGRLEALDYQPGRVDGTFDDQTRSALLRYQEDRRLPATGYMNDPTMVRILADTVISIFD